MLLTFSVQPRAVMAKRMAASALHNVVRLDVIPLCTLVIVVIPLRMVRSLGVPRRLVRHNSVKRAFPELGVYPKRMDVVFCGWLDSSTTLAASFVSPVPKGTKRGRGL